MANRISQLPVEVIAANIAVPPPRVTWRTGVFNVPGSPGSGSISNLDGPPKAVIFYGTNWTTEDAVETATGVGMFRGMVGPKWDDASLVQSAAFLSPPGDQHAMDDYAILGLTTGGTAATLYRATVDSLDSNGFSYTFDVASGGGYKIIYLAMMEDDTDVQIGSRTDVLNASFPLGFQAGAALWHGAWAGPVITGTDRTQDFYGGAAYRTTGHANWKAAFLSALCFPTSSSGQAYNERNANQDPTILSTTGVHFLGPFLITSNLKFHPSGTYLDEFTQSGDAEDAAMVIAWDDPDSDTTFLTPAASVSGTATVSGMPFEPGLLLGYTISRVPNGSSTGGQGAAGFFVSTQDFQWCATVDGTSAMGAFQSFQRGFCDSVSGAGVHAGTVQLTEDGFVATTTEADISEQVTSWQAFGHPRRASWIPHIYRRESG